MIESKNKSITSIGKAKDYWKRHYYDGRDLEDDSDDIAMQKISELMNRKITDHRIENEKAKTKASLIATMRESIPSIISLEKRQKELLDEIQFSLKLEVYSDGLVEKIEEYTANQKILDEKLKYVEMLVKMKLGY